MGCWGLLGVAGMIITSDYGSFPHSLRLAPVSSWFLFQRVPGTNVVKWKHDAVPYVVVNLNDSPQKIAIICCLW